MKKQRGFTAFELFILTFWIVIPVGWIANIVQIVKMINDPITVLLMLKGIGTIVFPLGAVLGWLGFFM